jgi:hypothetical protein
MTAAGWKEKRGRSCLMLSHITAMHPLDSWRCTWLCVSAFCCLPAVHASCIQVALLSAAAVVAVIVAGISRLMLDSFPDDPVLYVTEQGPAHAAAVVLSSDQEAQMVAMQKTLDFGAIPGTLQMLQVGIQA